MSTSYLQITSYLSFVESHRHLTSTMEQARRLFPVTLGKMGKVGHAYNTCMQRTLYNYNNGLASRPLPIPILILILFYDNDIVMRGQDDK